MRHFNKGILFFPTTYMANGIKYKFIPSTNFQCKLTVRGKWKTVQGSQQYQNRKKSFILVCQISLLSSIKASCFSHTFPSDDDEIWNS